MKVKRRATPGTSVGEVSKSASYMTGSRPMTGAELGSALQVALVALILRLVLAVVRANPSTRRA